MPVEYLEIVVKQGASAARMLAPPLSRMPDLLHFLNFRGVFLVISHDTDDGKS